jgi:flavin-dependent dehydrogenase
MKSESHAQDCDVAILGGALAGAATAILLLRRNPALRVVILEKSDRFGRRVGEATVEVSGYFLSRVLGLASHLNEHHLTKQGMRFWFANERAQSLADCSEIGGRYLARVPAWQVDRSVLDEEVLRRARDAGAIVLRPAKALRVDLDPAGNTIHLEDASGARPLRARWVVDGTGFAALLARQNGWFRRNEAHPTTSAWTRWRGVKDLDGLELSGRFPEWAAACRGLRSTATNHIMGDGWWAWCIPLKGGDYSIGVVFDHRRVRLPEGPTICERLRRFLVAHPVARELLEHAEPIGGDAHWRTHLPYASTRFAGDGFVLVGDAAAFLDPFYSPGMDGVAYTVTRAVELVSESMAGKPVAPLVESHNRDFARAYDRWFDAVYRDKYDVFGDFDLMSRAFRLDLALYYVGVVSQPFERGPASLRDPVFTLPPSEIPFRLMRLYNRRLARMARERRRRGTFGKSNAGRRFLLNGFVPERGQAPAILRGLLSYAALEIREGWRSWFGAEPPPVEKQTG